MLPEVGSTIVPPGFSSPSRSAASIIASPIRSLTEPPGFRYSSLARIVPGTSAGDPVEPDDRRRPDQVEDVGYSRAIARMQFGLLGPLAVWRDGHEVPLGAAKQHALLAALLLRANEVVPTARLIDALVGRAAARAGGEDRAGPTCRDCGVRWERGVVETGWTGGYVVRVEPDALDVDRFERLLERGRGSA